MPSAAAKRERIVMRPEQRLEELLAAAARVLAERGFSATTVSDITDAAGVAKGTFYWYFRSKDQLVGVLWERYVDGFLSRTAAVLARVAQDGDWWSALDDLGRSLIQHAFDHAELHRIVYNSANASALELCRESDRKVITLLADTLGQGIRAGAFHAERAELTARLLYFAVDGLLHDVIISNEVIDIGQVIAAARELTHKALAPRQEPAADHARRADRSVR